MNVHPNLNAKERQHLCNTALVLPNWGVYARIVQLRTLVNEERMSDLLKRPTIIYPAIGAEFDLWFVRLSGHGLGNCFYTYFHAVALAERVEAQIITPPWLSLKPGTFIRRESSKRTYWRMFRPYAGELHGLCKLLALLKTYGNRKIIKVGGTGEAKIIEGSLNVVTNTTFTFQGLYAYRDVIRQRLLGVVNDPVPSDHSWGKSGFIGVHVRLGDFAPVADPKLVSSGRANTRIPLSWYVTMVQALQKRYPDMPVRVFSDGKEDELQPLLALGATIYRSGSDMTDLLAMSSASVLVGSHSTYSRWAVFLGDMPSIWLKTDIEDEKPSSLDTPILYVPIDVTEPVLWTNAFC